MSTLTIELPTDVAPDEARLLLSIKLFELGRLSLGQAAELARQSKRDYVDLLDRHGIPVIDYPPDELSGELEL